jgi:hypothetical protein
MIYYHLDINMFDCFFKNCNKKYGRNSIQLRSFIEHLKHHEYFEYPKILPTQCNICTNSKSFITFTQLQVHLSKQHLSKETVDDMRVHLSDELNDEVEDLNLIEVTNGDTSEENQDANIVFDCKHGLKEKNLKDHIKFLRSMTNIPLTTINKLVEYILTMDRDYIEIMKSLSEKSTERMKQIQMLAKNNENYNSTYKQDKLHTSSEYYIKPTEFRFGSREEFSLCHNKRKVITREETFQYIPISRTLKVILKNEQVREVISQNNFHCDFIPTHYSSKFWSNKNTLRIILYYDEVEIKNPLGNINFLKILAFFNNI